MQGQQPVERLEMPDRPATHEEWYHLERYRWACGIVSGRVLDVACGTGFGSAMLAGVGRVVGLDREPEAVDLALRRHRSPARYVISELPSIPLRTHAFDYVVTFETVEHVDADLEYLTEVRRVLKRGGTMLLSTPNKAFTSPHGPPANPWHVREYLLGDLLDLVRAAGFRDIDVLAQAEPSRSLGHRALLRLLGLYPPLGDLGRWWNRILHDLTVHAHRPDRVPYLWVLRCR